MYSFLNFGITISVLFVFVLFLRLPSFQGQRVISVRFCELFEAKVKKKKNGVHRSIVCACVFDCF